MANIKPNPNHFIWIDLEMTGLDPDKERIIEIATVVTDANLNVVAEGPSLAIQTPEEKLLGMDDWNTKQHNASGLVDRVRESEITIEEAQARTLDFMMTYVPPNKSPMCGNSVHQDRRFLVRYMPKLIQYFHYRNLDVSTLKILAKAWAPDVSKGFRKETCHLALQDIYDSIDELKYYRDHWILKQS